MHSLVKKLKSAKEFEDETRQKREKEVAAHRESTSELPPVFNKRIFVAQSSTTVLITGAAKRIMQQTADRLEARRISAGHVTCVQEALHDTEDDDDEKSDVSSIIRASSRLSTRPQPPEFASTKELFLRNIKPAATCRKKKIGLQLRPQSSYTSMIKINNKTLLRPKSHQEYVSNQRLQTASPNLTETKPCLAKHKYGQHITVPTSPHVNSLIQIKVSAPDEDNAYSPSEARDPVNNNQYSSHNVADTHVLQDKSQDDVDNNNSSQNIRSPPPPPPPPPDVSSKEISRPSSSLSNNTPSIRSRGKAHTGIQSIEAGRKALSTLVTNMPDDSRSMEALTRQELLSMRSVTDGLHLIHQCLDYVKDSLAHCVTYETYGPYEYVERKPDESVFSCYYILNGTVEATYDIIPGMVMRVYEPNIIYPHGPGEYLGIVSHEDPALDLAPPSTIYTKEPCELVRVDRKFFHGVISETRRRLNAEKMEFMERSNTVLSQLTDTEKQKLLPCLIKQEFGPNQTVLSQGSTSEHIFFIKSGRCSCWRAIHLPRYDEEVMLQIGNLDQGDHFGDDCILDKVASRCTIRTKCITVCYRLHRSEFEILDREHLNEVVANNRNKFRSDEELIENGNALNAWKKYKCDTVKPHLIRAWGNSEYFERDFQCYCPKRKHWIEVENEEYVKEKLLWHFMSPVPRRHDPVPSKQDVDDIMEQLHIDTEHDTGDEKKVKEKSGSSRQVSGTTDTKDKGDLVAMETTEILKHANLLSSEHAEKVQSRREHADQEEPHQDVLSDIHGANLDAKVHMMWGKYRMVVLNRKLQSVRRGMEKARAERKRQLPRPNTNSMESKT